jgi:hypothetical protein
LLISAKKFHSINLRHISGFGILFFLFLFFFQFSFANAEILSKNDSNSKRKKHLIGKIHDQSQIRKVENLGKMAGYKAQNLTAMSYSNGYSLVGQLAGGVPESAVIQGNFAYIAAGGILSIIDISNPAHPFQRSYFELLGDARGITLVGNIVYVASWCGVKAVDITNPDAPVAASDLLYIRGFTNAVAIKNKYAYIAQETDYAFSPSGFFIMDISNTQQTTYYVYTTNPANDVALYQNYAYVAASYDGLLTYDVTDPTHPLQVSQINGLDCANRISIKDHFAYVAYGNSGLRIFDLNNPAAPNEIGHYSSSDYAKGVSLKADFAYCTCGNVLHVVDVTNPGNPILTGLCALEGDASGVVVDGNYAYVSCRGGGFRVVNISNPTNPVAIGNFNTPGDVMDLIARGNYCYIAEGTDGLRIVDYSDPHNPFEIGSVLTAQALSLCLNGNYAYVADENEGMWIIDVSNPANPIKRSRLPCAGFGIAAKGSYAFVTDLVGLGVINVSDPGNPSTVGYLNISGYPRDLVVQGDYAYVTADETGLHVINIHNPSLPVEVSHCSFTAWLGKSAIRDNYLYLTDASFGFRIYDNNPISPTEVGGFGLMPYASGVAVDGNYAYVATYGDGLNVINVNNPHSPVKDGFYYSPGNALNASVSDNKIFLGCNQYGLVILERTPPTPTATMTPIFTVTPTPNWAIATLKGKAALAFPNPGKNQIQFFMNISKPTKVQIQIFNMVGEKVTELSADLASGEGQRMVWNCNCAYGVYIARIIMDGKEKGRLKLAVVF